MEGMVFASMSEDANVVILVLDAGVTGNAVKDNIPYVPPSFPLLRLVLPH